MSQEPDRPTDAEEPNDPQASGTRWLPVALSVATLAVVILGVYLVVRLLVADAQQLPPEASTSPTDALEGFEPSTIAFFGPDAGLVAGSIPCPACPGDRGGLIARTSDGGESWRVVRETDRPVRMLTRAGNGKQAWAAVTDCTSQAFVGCDITYLRSTDAGLTWVAHRPPRDSTLASPPLAPGPCLADHPYPVSSSFPTGGRGWVLCSLKPTGMVEQYKGLYATSDGGKTWLELPEFHPVTGGVVINQGNMPEDGFPAGVSFLANGRGWMWTHGPASSLSSTDNGGRRWKRLWHSPENGQVRLLSASLINGTGGWVLLRRDDAGSELLTVTVQPSDTAILRSVATWPIP